MGAGVVDYLVKLDLTPENLQTALAKADSPAFPIPASPAGR